MLSCDRTHSVAHAEGVLMFYLGREVANGDMYIGCLPWICDPGVGFYSGFSISFVSIPNVQSEIKAPVALTSVCPCWGKSDLTGTLTCLFLAGAIFKPCVILNAKIRPTIFPLND